MFSKANTKKLLPIFAILLIVILFLQLREKKKGNRNFKSELFSIDTTAIRSIQLYDKNDLKTELTRYNDSFKVSVGDKKYNTSSQQISYLLTTLSNLKSKRIAATSKDKWKEYKVIDTLAQKVVVSTKKDEFALLVGKFSYQQPPQGGQNPYQMRQNVTMTTYVRIEGEDEVYAVDGFLSGSFSQSPNSFRIKTVLNADVTNLTKLKFDHPDSSFVMEKNASGNWMIDGIATDSVEVKTYLNSISGLTRSEFVDDANLGMPKHTLTIEGDNFKTTFLKAYEADSTHGHYITSSQNDEAIFSGNDNSLWSILFAGKEKLLKKNLSN